MTRARTTLSLCGDGPAELRASYCQELRARLVQRGVQVQLVDGPLPPAAASPDAGWALVLARRGEPPPEPPDPASGSILVCLHPDPCPGGVQVLPAWVPVAAAVDRTLAVLEEVGALAATAEDIRHDEELMIRRLYDLGYL